MNMCMVDGEKDLLAYTVIAYRDEQDKGIILIYN